MSDCFGEQDCGYSYDNLNQLASEEGLAFHTYTHDSLYNRVEHNGRQIQINDLNQVTHANGKSYTYDPSGNILSDTTGEYSYDALDRLITVTKNEEKYRYIYDSQNRRIAKRKYRKTAEGWSLERTIKFLYQDNSDVGSIEDGQVTSFRPLGEGRGAEIGAAFAIEINENVYIPFYDQAGSVTVLVDTSTNTPIYSARYSSFGQVEKSTGIDSPYQFSSKRYDPESGWIYFGRRYYDPSLGRWTTGDPAGYSDGFNLYAYVRNNPLTFVDQFGLFRTHYTQREYNYFDSEEHRNGMCYNCWAKAHPMQPKIGYTPYPSMACRIF